MKVVTNNTLSYFWSKLKTLLGAKQDTLVSGTNIKTLNGQSLLGGGNVAIHIPPAPPEPLLVYMTESGGTYSLDKEVLDIEDALSDNDELECYLVWDGNNPAVVRLRCYGYNVEETIGGHSQSCVVWSGLDNIGNRHIVKAYHDSTNDVDVVNYSIASPDGKGITSIAKTATVGLVDTYTITYSDGTTSTYTVTNGRDGQNGRDGVDGQDGADGVSLGEVALVQTTGDSTESVMSQKAVTDAIEDISNKVSLPTTAVMKDNKYTSVKKYNISNLMNVWYIEKGLAKRALSWGWRNDLWFTLWKDSRNYFGVYRNETAIKVRLVVNNSVVQTENLVATQASTTNAYASVAFCIDLNRKVISCYSISSGALITVGSVDISTWDLSSFSEVSIYNSAFGQYHWIACDRIIINDYFDVENLLKYQFAEGRYNTLSNQAKQDPVIIPHTSLLVGGTVTSEISNVHKISSVTNNNGAFKLGPSVATGAKGRYFVKFKITSGTCKVTLGNGAAPILLDSNFNYLRTLTNVQSTLENDTIYVLVFAVNGSLISGAVTSFLRAYGSFTIETLDCGAFITQSMNVCAETFDGQYYIGNIPFKANSSSWVNEINWDTNDNTTWNGIAKYARYVNTSGNIMMFNGTVWKQINNS